MVRVSFQKARSCCFHLAGPGEPWRQQRSCARKQSCVHLGSGSGCIVWIKYRLHKQFTIFVFMQIILQQLQNPKMGIMQEQITQVRFFFCENHNSQNCLRVCSPPLSQYTDEESENPEHSTAVIPWNVAIIDNIACRCLTMKLIRFLIFFKW